MSYRYHMLGGQQLLGIDNCPHCGVASPMLLLQWASNPATPRSDGGEPSRWAAYACRSCGHLVSAKGEPSSNSGNPMVVAVYPDVFEVDESVPDAARNYLSQAHQTLASPDASVLMSAASIDAMLKDHDLIEGSLYARIDEAVTGGILTQAMATWAHRVRLDANSTRHADTENPHMDIEDAERAFEFAKALAQFLYVLPSRMPAPPDEDSE